METNVLSNINLNNSDGKIEDFLNENIVSTLGDTIDKNLCISIKNKNTYVQCPRKKKKEHEYCGYHCRAKNVIRYDLWLKSQLQNVKKTKNKIITKIIKN